MKGNFENVDKIIYILYNFTGYNIEIIKLKEIF